MAIQDHPIAKHFPKMSGEEFEALKADIAANGQQEPIILHEDKILDGRHRYRACQELELEPRTRKWTGECGTPAAFVASMNLHRRHLTASQRASIAVSLASPDGFDRKIADRQLTDRQGEKPGLSLEDAAAMMQVGKRTVEDAKVVMERGTEREKAVVREGVASASSVAKEIRSGKPAIERGMERKKKGVPKSRLASPERPPASKSARERELVTRVQVSVLNLFAMPPAAEMVATVRGAKGMTVIEDRLPGATNWLKDFHDEWERAKARDNGAGP